MAQRDLNRLDELRDTFADSLELTREVRLTFYQRLMNVRADLVRKMDKFRQAYRFMALEESIVTLDPTKSMEDIAARNICAVCSLGSCR